MGEIVFDDYLFVVWWFVICVLCLVFMLDFCLFWFILFYDCVGLYGLDYVLGFDVNEFVCLMLCIGGGSMVGVWLVLKEYVIDVDVGDRVKLIGL